MYHVILVPETLQGTGGVVGVRQRGWTGVLTCPPSFPYYVFKITTLLDCSSFVYRSQTVSCIT